MSKLLDMNLLGELYKRFGLTPAAEVIMFGIGRVWCDCVFGIMLALALKECE